MPRNIIYIINPYSGPDAAKPGKPDVSNKINLKNLIEKRTAQEQISFQVFPSVASGDYSFLRPLIKEKKVTDVVIAGGDGTVSQVIHSLMNCAVNFGIIPAGSGNGLAYTAHIPKQPDKALDIIFSGKAVSTDGFYLNDHFACMLCGLGFDAKVAHDFAEQPKRGLSTYIKQIVKNFFSAQPYQFEIQLGKTTLQTNAFFISIANSNQYGNNFTIAPKASLSDGLLDIVIVTDQNKLSLLVQTIKQVRGKNKLLTKPITETKNAILYFQTDKLRIRNLSQAPLHIDGDPAETPDEVFIEIKKKCFRLIQPL
jgi:YegS/Rv2252/BmrU family lipid kinase